MTPAPPQRLYLASASPRRADLLRQAGYDFEQRTPPFDDSTCDLGTLPPHRATPDLAYRKAASLADTLDSGVVLGCDTLLSIDDHPVGKPSSAADARRILALLLDRSHQVVTAVCILDAGSDRQRMLVDTATVHIGHVDPDTLEAYVRSGNWRGKAGGYNLTELQDDWPIHVEGDPTTVIGLPMRRLADALPHFTSSANASKPGSGPSP